EEHVHQFDEVPVHIAEAVVDAVLCDRVRQPARVETVLDVTGCLAVFEGHAGLLAPRAASGSTVPAFYPLEPSHMPSRRGAIALTQEEQEKFLAESWTLQVAS